MLKYLFSVFSLIIIFSGCGQFEKSKNNNPAAEGFNKEASDTKAIAIADSVMQAMGGRQNWDQTKIIQWTFMGKRTHTWNKQTGKDRIKLPDRNMVITLNVQSKEGTVMKNGQEITQPDSIKKHMRQGYEMWVNDSYWLFMPFKLKDSGVTLKYKGVEDTQAGEPAYKLQLTFDSVGVTPQNKFYVLVDTSDYMVKQWTYFPKKDADKPGFVLTWENYKKHGNILLSGDRGEYELSDIKVMDEWPQDYR